MVNKKKTCHGCNTLTYIYKCIDGKKYCKSCTYKLSSKPTIKQVSVKKQKENNEYSKLRTTYLDTHPFCEAKIPGECTVTATDIHHTMGRLGGNYLNTETWIALCRACHNYVELHVEIAKELNLSKILKYSLI